MPTLPVCKPRLGSCDEFATEKRVFPDIRVAWIDYDLRFLCKAHAIEWDTSLDQHLENATETQLGSKQAWIKSRDMNRFMKDGLSLREAYGLIQSAHGYVPPKGPVRLS